MGIPGYAKWQRFESVPAIVNKMASGFVWQGFLQAVLPARFLKNSDCCIILKHRNTNILIFYIWVFLTIMNCLAPL